MCRLLEPPTRERVSRRAVFGVIVLDYDCMIDRDGFAEDVDVMDIHLRGADPATQNQFEKSFQVLLREADLDLARLVNAVPRAEPD